jgi:hypothetical protein
VANARLTVKQRRLVAELKHSLATLMLDPDTIVADEDADGRTPRLELARDQIIRSEIVQRYVLMDEFLSAIMCWHYFGKRRGFPELWRTKRFQSFNYFVLERLYLLQKLDLVRSIHEIPKWVASDLAALNDLRNGIAHSFFPQNRRRKPDWKGTSVFTDAGFERFREDMAKLANFFVEHFWAGSAEDTGDRPDITAQEPNGA